MSRDYRKIHAYQLAKELVLNIYRITKKFPREELFGLISQMRRASISICSNIAEGAVRKSKKEYLQFLYTSMGSFTELECQIDLSTKLGYINNSDFENLNSICHNTGGKLFRLIEAVEKEI